MNTPIFNSLRPFGFLLASLSLCLIFGAADAFAAPQSIPISSPADLDLIRATPSADFHLTNDIDLAGVANFQPIGTNPAPFTGTFEGNNHSIRNLAINECPQSPLDVSDLSFLDEDFTGLFAFTDGASIQNLKLTGVSVFGESMVGALVGQCRQSTITNCSATGTVGGQRQVGGLIGFMGNSDVVDCWTDVSVEYCEVVVEFNGGTFYQPTFWFGGVVGHAHPYRFPGRAPTNTGDGSSLNGCIAFGDVYGGFIAGGVVGNFHGSSGSNCYAIGDVETEFSTAGGLVGYIQTEVGLPVASPTPIQTTFFNSIAFGSATANAWGSPNPSGGFFPSPAGVGAFAGPTAGGFIGYCEGGLTDSGPNPLPLAVITACSAFGNVEMLEPLRVAIIPVGGFVGRTEVDTLIRGCQARGDANGMGATGGFVGWGEGVIEDSEAYGNVTATDRSGGFGGQVASTRSGLAGETGPFRGTFLRCASFGSTESIEQASVGGEEILGIAGFVGYSFGGVDFIGCESHGAAIATSEFSGWVGGFIGHASNDRITECFSAGDVITGFGGAGGFVGRQRLRNGLQVDNCYATGDVMYTGSSTPLNIGGFIGSSNENATIANCYSAGNINVSGATVGGFVGNSNNITFTSCYWDTTTVGQNLDVGTFVAILISRQYQAAADINGDLIVSFLDLGPFIALGNQLADQPTGVNGRSTEQMQQQATFVGWNFNNIWDVVESVSYPFFQ